MRGCRHRAAHLSLLTCGGRLGPAAAALLCAMAMGPRTAFSQTPAPLQEWQYSAGIVLVQMFEPTLPDWRVEIGLAAEPRPAYEGARNYRTLAGPVVDVRYRDIYFASVGEGIASLCADTAGSIPSYLALRPISKPVEFPIGLNT